LIFDSSVSPLNWNSSEREVDSVMAGSWSSG
jgi:hypothetical protein